MKKIFLLLSFYLCVSFMMFSTDSIQGEGSGKRIIISGRDKHTVMHLVEPSVTYFAQTSTVTVDFGNQPVNNYTVTISTPFNDVDYYATSSFTTIPLAVDGISDYSIVIETEDGDVFEGTLYAIDYTTSMTI